jgi:hypothetical protein
MSEDLTSSFERRARTVLQESLSRVDARTRSRLNQARHAALEQAARPLWTRWAGLRLMPASGAVAAAVLVALMFFNHHPQQPLTVGDSAQPLDVFDLVADDEALNLVEDGDHAFYEWASEQDEATGGDANSQEST